jgi:hypothetical protein
MQSPDSRETYLAALREVLREGIVLLEVTGAFERLTPHLDWEQRADVFRTAQVRFGYLALPPAFIHNRFQVLSLWPGDGKGVRASLPADTYVAPARNGSPAGFPFTEEAVRHARREWAGELRPLSGIPTIVAFAILNEDRSGYMKHPEFGLAGEHSLALLVSSGGRPSHLTLDPAEIREILRPAARDDHVIDIPIAYYGHRTGDVISPVRFRTQLNGFVAVTDPPILPGTVRDAFACAGYFEE